LKGEILTTTKKLILEEEEFFSSTSKEVAKIDALLASKSISYIVSKTVITISN